MVFSFFSGSSQERKQRILLWGSGEERITIYRWNSSLPKQERRKLTSSLIGFGFGLPLHLWTDKVMKQIDDQCGGRLETEEETTLKNHLRWAQIRVKGPREKIPMEIEIEDGVGIFLLPVWCEAPARFKKKKREKHSDRYVRASIDPSEYAEETILPLDCEKRVNTRDDQDVYTGEPSKDQLVILDEPLPIEVMILCQRKPLMTELLYGCKRMSLNLADYLVLPLKDAIRLLLNLFLKIDQKREFFKQNMEKHINDNNSNNIPREMAGRITSRGCGEKWGYNSVMGQENVERRELWRDQINLKNTCTGPWLFCGDFNVTRYPMERSTGQRLTGAMSDFTDWINEMELIDPPLFGGLYTWRKGENHSTASRLDNSHHWDDFFSQIRQSLLPSLESDHNPVMLTCGKLNLKKSYFKFEQWWMQVEGFREKVNDWWCSFSVNGTPSFILASKLKLLKGKLKQWGYESRVNWKQNKEEIIKLLVWKRYKSREY
ncbi:hypothetical protein MTR67_031612 [Solanum verrucosum]|uniref:DUF4283 domain-containing protein n=1 Tax=Solanum verrucosum TaxID=315347 RepID=A0AAF0U2Q6_SOLVR|nr:hypothetical protein MTR67_031612 [Solanum verrucosum]